MLTVNAKTVVAHFPIGHGKGVARKMALAMYSAVDFGGFVPVGLVIRTLARAEDANTYGFEGQPLIPGNDVTSFLVI
jgi:hypothetical protein